MREGAAGEWRGSRAAVLMVPRVRSEVAEGAAGEWKERLWDYDLELKERQCGWRTEMEAEMVTFCAFMWSTHYHKCPCLNRWHGKPIFRAEGKRERHLIFDACWRDCSARCEIKFSGGQTAPSALHRLEFRAALVVAFLVFS
jgi:hypothetical protein